MQCGKSLLSCALVVLAGCGGATSEPGESGGAGGASTTGGTSSSGGSQASSGGKSSAGGNASTGGLSGSGGTNGSGGTRATGGLGSGGVATGGTPPGCEPIPTEPVYSCKMRPYQADDCLAWVEQNFAADRVLGGYPRGCRVTLPRLDAFSRCGPQSCTCEPFPGPEGEFKNDWVCPL